MKEFIHNDFLLQSDAARRLYHEYSGGCPILDYHCHLPVKEMAENRSFENLTHVWLAGDHYKWRAMRTNGIPEALITGNASDEEKFRAWAATVPHTLRNPLYHWTHMELKRPFGITNRLLTGSTAGGIWEECNALLATPDFSSRGLISKANVRLICTTDDPLDTLEHHHAIAEDSSWNVRVLPTFRPDKAMAVHAPAIFRPWIESLEELQNATVKSYSDLVYALGQRHDFFHAHDCRVSDHGLEFIDFVDTPEADLNRIFLNAREGIAADPTEAVRFRGMLMVELGRMNHRRGWAQQFHLGALRNSNARMHALLGPDTGYDCIGDFPQVNGLARLMGKLDSTSELTRTIIYNLNPADNEAFAALIGSFQEGPVRGKIQFGSGWWFLDQKEGMERQINALSNMGLLSMFIGMLTDSRSFISYSRHDYFRRILCNLLGSDIEDGLLPNDDQLVGGMIKDICFKNAALYFGWEDLLLTEEKRNAVV
jgi:glucuronate isomerase